MKNIVKYLFQKKPFSGKSLNKGQCRPVFFYFFT